jgi:hypothetical protein
MCKWIALATLAGIACIATTRGALAQRVGSVRGTIRLASGAPLANGLVWTPSERAFRPAHSDSLGRFRLDSLRVGTVQIEVLCPSRVGGFAVPVALNRVVRINGEHPTELEATVPADACVPIPPRAVHVHWRGSYSSGFENSSFYPCPIDSLAREVRT